MSIEVEIKAWVDNFEEVLGKLNKSYKYINEYNKEDSYLKGIDSISGLEKELRIRLVGGSYIVTFKERSHRDKVEVNIEKEFGVDNKENFIYMINQLGYKEYITKNKKGYLFVSKDINIELSHVEFLGDFIEIEYIIEDDKDVNFATNSIYEILDKLNIPREKIEDKYYVEMLQNKKNGDI